MHRIYRIGCFDYGGYSGESGDVDPAFEPGVGQFVGSGMAETGRILRPHGGAHSGDHGVETVIVGEAVVAYGVEVGNREG